MASNTFDINVVVFKNYLPDILTYNHFSILVLYLPAYSYIGIYRRLYKAIMQGEMSLLFRKRQGKSLLMSCRVQQERKMYTGLQSKWQNPGRM